MTKDSHHSKDTKRKLSIALKGRKRFLSDETKRKISLAFRGRHLSEETKAKMSSATKGRRLSAEWKKKLSLALIGERNPRWRGGSRVSYAPGWTKIVRRAIRERDFYKCKLCGIPQNGSAHHIHHIDYDKRNNNPDNLITLCVGCHSRTNQDRETWPFLLQELHGEKA